MRHTLAEKKVLAILWKRNKTYDAFLFSAVCGFCVHCINGALLFGNFDCFVSKLVVSLIGYYKDAPNRMSEASKGRVRCEAKTPWAPHPASPLAQLIEVILFFTHPVQDIFGIPYCHGENRMADTVTLL